MPVFRTHTAELRGGSLSTPRATAASFGGQTAVALQGLGKQGQQLAQQMADIAERREKLEAQKRIAQFREEAIAKQDELALQGEPMAETFQEFLDAGLHDILQDFRTRDARAWVQTKAPTLRSMLMQQARVRDSKLVGDLAQEQVDTWLRSNAVTLQSAPELFAEVLVDARDLVGSLEVPDHLKPQMRRDLRAALAANAAQGWIRADPQTGLAMLQEGKFDAYLEPDTRQRLIGNANTLIRAQRQDLEDQRKEFDRQKGFASDRAAIDALIALESPSDEDRLTAPGIAALASQTFEDGDPVLPPGTVGALFTRRRTIAEHGATKTDGATAIDVITRLETITEGELREKAEKGLIAAGDLERWVGEVRSGDSPLRAVRSRALKNVHSFMDIPGTLASALPGFGQAVLRADVLAREREQEYREAGHNPIAYYKNGVGNLPSFRDDVISLANQDEMLAQFVHETVVEVVDAQKGDRKQMGNWIFELTGDDPLLEENWTIVGPAADREAPDG